MASLTKIDRRYVVQVKNPHDGSRATINVGRVSQRQARTIKAHIENIASAKASNTAVPMDTAGWLNGIGEELHRRIARTGLIDNRDARQVTDLDTFFAGYITGRTDLKPRSLANLQQVRTFAVKYFGADRDIAKINRGQVKDWYRALLVKHAGATVAMHIKKMRQLYTDAIDRGLVTENPFRAVKAGSMSNSERQHYIAAADIIEVIEACPDLEWKLIFALARFAGLRVPSETRGLRWSDIDWAKGRFVVRSPKTEHHAGKDRRTVPIFPELYPFLSEAFTAAPEGRERIFDRLRGDNLATTGRKIVERAGIEPWPKLFQNLRASCETDLATRFPLHVACAWIGNSTGVAMKSYLQVHDAFFKSAAKTDAEGAGKGRKETVPESENRPFLPSDSAFGLPPRGVQSPAHFNGDFQKYHEALHKALHAVNCVARHGARIHGAQPDAAE